MDVALVSCRALPEPDPDAAPLARALAAAGVAAETLAWDDPDADWSAPRMAVLRSTWNYPLDAEGFLAWAERTAARTELFNPLPVVRWNAHKSYLVDLERQGVPVVPTALVPRGSATPLAQLAGGRGWTRVVVKPAVSAASRGTRRFDSPEAGEEHLRRLVRAGDVLVQRHEDAVDGYGERALVWIDGEVTHAVRKAPRFEGGAEQVSHEVVPIAPGEAELARRAVGAAGGALLYARVDVVPGPDGRPVLMELELIEPSLFFRQCPAALDRFVAAIRARLR